MLDARYAKMDGVERRPSERKIVEMETPATASRKRDRVECLTDGCSGDMTVSNDRRRRHGDAHVASAINQGVVERPAQWWKDDLRVCWNATLDSVGNRTDAAISARSTEERNRILGKNPPLSRYGKSSEH